MAWINFNDTDNQASTGWGSSNATQSSFTALEALTAWDAVTIWYTTSADASSLSWTSVSGFTSIWRYVNEIGSAQSFTTEATWYFELDKFMSKLRTFGSPTWTLTWYIYSDTGTTLLGTSTNTLDASTVVTGTEYDWNFDWIPLDPATTYYIQVRTDSSADSSNFLNWYTDTGNPYAWGQAYYVSDVNVWNARSTDDRYFSVTVRDAFWAIKTDASDANKIGFIGFADTSVSSDEAVNVNTAGTDQNQTWLTTNSTYYLSDTAWAISTTAGTNEKAVWTALSATEIAINLFSWGWWGYTAHAFANMTWRAAGGDHTLTSWYTNSSDFTVGATTITCNFDWYVNVRTMISMGTLDNDTNAWLAVHKNGTDQWTSTFVTYNNDETDTFDRFPMAWEWNISVADGDTLSIRWEVLTSLDTGKFVVDRVA